ncbi:MAG TPA: efflux RND transporter periplasmic adaptor subunit [Chthonomonadaceae bacterium]|nr:efflux RND transporter periplasmic adaptor subunit [Chthonomonadaceae bacterium]
MKQSTNTQPNTPLRRQILTSLGVVLVLSVIGFFLIRQARSETHTDAAPAATDTVEVSEAGQDITRIYLSPVREEAIESNLKATGLISYPADNTVKISPRLQGRIQQVFVRVGDHVNKGDTLAILDSVDAASAITTARQAENKLRLAENNLHREERLYQLGTPDVTQAQANLDQTKARTQATADALARTREQARIGGFTEKPLEDAKTAEVGANSDLAQAQSDLAQAQRDRDRKAKLVDIGVAAKSDLEAAENVLEKAKVAVQSDQEKLALAKQAVEREQKAFKTNLYADQQVRSAESDARQAQLQAAAAETALRLAKAAVLRDLEQAKSDYQSAQVDAENARRVLQLLGMPDANGTLRITAPIAGVVTERNVSPGQLVDQSQMTPWQMFTLSATETVWVDADVYEKDIADITPGKPVRIHIAALPGQEFTGTVLHIAPTLDPKTRAIKVRAEIANRSGLLKDGMYAEMTVLLGRGKKTLCVPLAAIQHDGDSDYVFVAESGKYRKTPVKLGAQLQDKCLIAEGLHTGEMVVVHGALFLSNEANGG